MKAGFGDLGDLPTLHHLAASASGWDTVPDPVRGLHVSTIALPGAVVASVVAPAPVT